MRTRRLLFIAIAICASRPAAAQTATIEDYVKRVTSVDPNKTSAADCTAEVAKASSLNAVGLFYGWAVCHAVKMDTEGNFLLAAGQVRGMADMGTMAPATKADMAAAAALYGFIYSYAGGPGNIDVLRIPQSRDRFFKLFDSWLPAASADYLPGWKVGQRPSDAEYRAALTDAKAGRRSQLSEMSQLYSDAHYYALQREFDELQKKTSGRYVEGTADAKLATDLERRMSQRARALGFNRDVPEPGAVPERRTPPSAPGKDETVVETSDDPAVKQCVEWAAQLTKMSLSKIVRVVMTTGSEWGLVWRADIASSDNPPEMSRYICSKYGTMLESGDAADRPPLP